MSAQEATSANAAAKSTDTRVGTDWQPIDTAPVTKPMESIKVLVWGRPIGVRTGSLHRWAGDRPTVTLSNVHGDVVEVGRVTHWQPLPEPPL